MIDNTNLKLIFNMFGEEVKKLVTQIHTETNMEDEHFATVVSGAVVGAMDSSVRALQVYKANSFTDTQIDLNKEKLEQTRRMTPFILDGARIDNNTKEQKFISEQIRNGGISFTYEFYRSYIDDVGNKIETNLIDQDTITVPVEQTIQNEDGTTTTQTINKEYILFRDYKRVASKTLNEGTGLSLAELQNLKIQEETDYIQSQNTQLVASVGYNNKLKVLNSLSSLWGTLGAGGFIVPETGWKPVFEIAHELGGTTLPSLATFQTDITSV